METQSKDKHEDDGTSRTYNLRSKSKQATGKEKVDEIASKTFTRSKRKRATTEPTQASSISQNNRKEYFFEDVDGVSFSWYHKKCLLRVASQGACVCCWSFVTSEVTAARLAIDTGKRPVRLSNQQMLDCLPAHTYVSKIVNKVEVEVIEGKGNDCYTMKLDEAFDYIKEVGLIRDKHYGYKTERGCCQQVAIQTNDRVKIASYKTFDFQENRREVTLERKNRLKKMLEKDGPLAASICEYPSFFEFKGDEEIYKPLPDELLMDSDHYGYHAIIVVGYDVDENGELHWLIKNSWDDWWGHKGYIKVSSSVKLYDVMAVKKPTVEKQR